MRLTVAVLSLAVLLASGCHSTPPAPPPQPAGRSLVDMEADYARQREAHQKKCLNAPPEQIKANQTICEAERESMAPLGNAIVKAEQDAARKQTNP